MPDFVDQDLRGARFERTSLRDATFTELSLAGARFRSVDLTDVVVRSAYAAGTRLIGIELVGVEITGELKDVTVNGVDIGPLVEAELDRRMPERVKMRPVDADGFREAWYVLGRLWAGTISRARSLPAEALHERVDGEWSFIDTVRHLSFATATWVGRMVLDEPSPWHPLDLPWEEAPEWDDIPHDADARPSLDEVLTLRSDRRAMVGEVLESLADEQLDATVTRTGPGWPQLEDFPVRECLLIVLNEEWEHRRYAERDLDALGAPPAP